LLRSENIYSPNRLMWCRLVPFRNQVTAENSQRRTPTMNRSGPMLHLIMCSAKISVIWSLVIVRAPLRHGSASSKASCCWGVAG
jgi:hypothetical protein